jgi:lipoprotein-anchoring transpeptidase ErfK/SrfK
VLDSDLSRAAKRDVPASRRVRLGIMAFCGIVGLFVAACSSPGGTSNGGSQAGQASSPKASPAAEVAIDPANGTNGANPSHGIAITASIGRITAVTVTTASHQVAGALASGGTSWHTTWPLHAGAHYMVNVTAANKDGKTTTTTSSFSTLNPAATFSAATVLGDQTYGVGMPISINFSSPVTHKAAVEKAIDITTSKPIVGAWMWDGNETLDFRPQVYWPAHTDVSFVAHFNGLEISKGVYGTANLSQSFRIGNSLIGVTSTRTHHTKIYYKGKLYAVWLDSSGMPGDDTANGTYLTIEKANPTLMTGQGYKNVPVYWSVRFTWSGNYYHSAPWSVGEQGYVNVSHGCVNLSPANAEWYYLHADPGDPITITGSPVSGAWDDGYTEWFYSWNQLLAHSATHMAVQAGPTGSTLVDPSTLPTPPANTWLTGSKPHNYVAGRG